MSTFHVLLVCSGTDMLGWYSVCLFLLLRLQERINCLQNTSISVSDLWLGKNFIVQVKHTALCLYITYARFYPKPSSIKCVGVCVYIYLPFNSFHMQILFYVVFFVRLYTSTILVSRILHYIFLLLPSYA